MEGAVRKDLEQWEADVLKAAAEGDEFAKWLKENVLGFYIFLVDGNHRQVEITSSSIVPLNGRIHGGLSERFERTVLLVAWNAKASQNNFDLTCAVERDNTRGAVCTFCKDRSVKGFVPLSGTNR